MMLSSATKRRFFNAPQLDMYSETVKVILDAEVAIHMVDDLGATIMNAKEYVPGEAVSVEESAE